VNILGQLQKRAKETQDRVDEILGAKSDEDERIKKLVDAFVEQLVKNPPEAQFRQRDRNIRARSRFKEF
jgi:hypothetical protein